jgi:hypothetical protein
MVRMHVGVHCTSTALSQNCTPSILPHKWLPTLTPLFKIQETQKGNGTHHLQNISIPSSVSLVQLLSFVDEQFKYAENHESNKTDLT